MPSAIASRPTLSRSQLSSSRRSAAARSVGSMRSRGPRMSPSQDRASLYVGHPSLKRATLSRMAPPSGGSHQMVTASHPCVYLRGLEHVGGVEYEAGGEGRTDVRGHIATPPHVWPRGRPQPSLGSRIPRVIGARPANHGGPWLGVRPPPLERDGGVLLRGGPRRARGCAPPAPFARRLRAHYAGLPGGHGAAPDDPWREEGVLQVLQGTPRQVPVRVGVLFQSTFQGAVHHAKGGHKAPAAALRRGGQSPSAAVSHRCTPAAALRGSRRSCSSW